MRYLIDVWFKSHLELSVVDLIVMTAEALGAAFAVAAFKVCVIDWFRGVKYYKKQ